MKGHILEVQTPEGWKCLDAICQMGSIGDWWTIPQTQIWMGSICSGKVEGGVPYDHRYWGGRGTDLELW